MSRRASSMATYSRLASGSRGVRSVTPVQPSTTGGLPGRDRDSAGLGVVFAFPSGGADAETEVTVEAAYRFRPLESLSLSAHLQVIFHPAGGAAGGDDAVVGGGLKMELEF